MPGVSNAVFLSYASEDIQAAQRIAAALRSAGIDVWFDQSELRGGDAWDQSIRRQIKTCALFIAIVSRHTYERAEGYFRLEWKLAVDRSHLIMADRVFLLPVAIDDTGGDHVPERFREVQWTRLPDGETPPAFVERIKRVLAGETSSVTPPAPPGPGARGVAATVWPRRFLVAAALAVIGTVAYLALEQPWVAKPPVAVAFAPPNHSVAVLPFLNLSGDKDQEYFSDGITEEVLNSLTQINELQVAARTSVFSFKGTKADIGTIARRLNVAAVLEGSVRRSGNTVRITAQLINSVTGFHVWSHTYDRSLGDILKLETEVAKDVAGALKVSLLGDLAAKIELGGTRNPAAFDAYLRGLYADYSTPEGLQTSVAAFTEATTLDDKYVLAFVERSFTLTQYGNVSGVREKFDQGLADARMAVALAPGFAPSHLALAFALELGSLDLSGADEEYSRALSLAPGDAQVLRNFADFNVRMGRFERGMAAGRRAVALDPLNESYFYFGKMLYFGRRYEDAAAAFQEAIADDPEDLASRWFLGFTFLEMGKYDRARASCETQTQRWLARQCLAVAYYRLGRHADAQRMVDKMKVLDGADTTALQFAEIYAQWGDKANALQWLETALRSRDPGLSLIKTDPRIDPLRDEPRFKAVMRELKFPQ
jgi:TolB-like protein/Tfp pilus assembly protein PilF